MTEGPRSTVVIVPASSSHAPPGVPGDSGELPKTMKALAGYLEREKANG